MLWLRYDDLLVLCFVVSNRVADFVSLLAYGVIYHLSICSDLQQKTRKGNKIDEPNSGTPQRFSAQLLALVRIFINYNLV